MAGNKNACKYIILMFIVVQLRLLQAIPRRRRRIEACFFQRKIQMSVEEGNQFGLGATA